MVAPLAVGEEVDGFRVEATLHAGGMALLYAVSHPAHPGPLVMKVPRTGHGEPAWTLVSYEAEQLVLGALTGPHAPRLVASGDLARRPYLVMELVEGCSLKDRADAAPLPADEVARLGRAVAAAIHDVHLQDVIHLDLKPSNVMIRPDGQAVLIDFGLAHHAHYPDVLAEEVRHPLGSAPYIAPETLLGVRWDVRSDVFSLGVILYELATGHLPFGAPTNHAGLRRRLYRDPVPPGALVPETPAWLQEVILRCLEPSADDRTATAAQVAFELSHPDQVTVTERGRRRRQAGRLATLRRWVKAAGLEPSAVRRPASQVARAPIIVAAVATGHGDDAHEAFRVVARRLLAGDPAARLACLTVIKPSPELGGAGEADTPAARRVEHLVRLRRFAEPLELPPHRLSFHVLEAPDAAAAIVEYASANRAGQILIGAPPRRTPALSLPMTVSVRVALDARCPVTLIRPDAAG